MRAASPSLSWWQILLLVFILSLCLTPFDLPGLLMPLLGPRSAWWGVLPALAVGMWGITVASALVNRFPGRTMDRTVLSVLGPTLGYAYLAALTGLFIFSVLGCLLVFGPAAQQSLLPRLPVAFVAVMVAGVGTYAARSGPEAVARCAETLAPFLAVGLLVIYVPLAVIHLRPGGLLPLRPPAWSAWLSPQMAGATGTIRGFLPLLVLGPLLARRVPTGRFALAAGLAWLLIVGALVLPVLLFGGPLVRQFSFPMLAAESTIGWRYLPSRSLVELTLLVWYALTFLVFATYLWMAGWLVRRLIPALPRRGPVEFLGLGAAIMASVHFSELTFQVMFEFWNVGVVVLGVLVPTGILLLASRRSARPAGPGPG